MFKLISLMIVVLAGSDAFDLDLSLVPGLSAKNVLLNIVAAMLVLQAILGTPPRMEFKAIQICFVILIGYALLTLVSITFFIHFPPRYNWKAAGMRLKIDLLDNLLFFGAVFYGLRTNFEVRAITKLLLGSLTFMNFITILNFVGLIDVGISEVGDNPEEYGRVFGAFGHPNGTGAVIVCFLPAYFIVAERSRGPAKLGWYVSALISITVLMLTASRGAMVGFVVGGAWGLFICRKYVDFPRLVRWALVVVAFLAVIGPIFSMFGSVHENMMVERVLHFDLSTGGSGRDRIWRTAINRMMASPLSLVTGFGWNSYDAMGYYLALHNQYLWLWFELGLIGLSSYVASIWLAVRYAMRAVDVAKPEDRGYLLALVFSMLILSITVFFTLLYRPWAYLWIYVGATLRMAAVSMREYREQAAAKVDAVAAEFQPRRPIGGVTGPLVHGSSIGVPRR